MKTIGRLFIRTATSVAMVLFSLTLTLPMSASVSAAPVLNAPIQSDDFNRCTFNNSIWTFENPASTQAVFVSDPFTANAAATLTVPAGQDLTFSNTNLSAPRIMQNNIDNADFEVEAKFLSPLGVPTANNWNMQGILVRDTISSPGTTKWLRFELDVKSDSINYYIGYINEADPPNNRLHHVKGVNIISSQNNAAPLYIRVKYQASTGTWNFGYSLGDYSTWFYKNDATFTNAAPGTYTTPITFTPNAIGVFAASTGPSPSGITSRIDYFRNVADTAFTDDGTRANVTIAGFGTGNYASTCSGNNVVLTANPTNGSTFGGWSGDATSNQPTITLPMTRPYTLMATFNSGTPVDLPYKIYIPNLVK